MTRSQRTLVSSLLAFVLALVTYQAFIFGAAEDSLPFFWAVFLICPYWGLTSVLFAFEYSFAAFLAVPMIAAEIFLYVAIIRRARIRGRSSRALIWLIAVHVLTIIGTLAAVWVSLWRRPM